MLSFLFELALRAFHQSFDLVWGTIGTIAISCLGGLIFALLVRRFRGRKAFMEHIKTTIFAVLGTFLTWVIVFCCLLIYQPYKITKEPCKISSPSIAVSKRPPPSWTFEPPPPMLDVSWRAHDGFDLQPTSGNVVFDNKRQYSLTIINSGEKPIFSTDLDVAFPFAVEAQNVVRARGAVGVTFEPWRPLGFPGARAGGIKTPNCLATGSYRLRIAQLSPHGKLEIGVILNSSPYLGRVGNDYICGHFNSWYHDKPMYGEYFAPFEAHEDAVVLGAVRNKPSKLRNSIVFQVLLAPCIPNGSLREEFHLPATRQR